MRIVLQPASLDKRVVKRHFEHTIDNRVAYTNHADSLGAQVLADLDTVYPDRTAQMWGATPGRNDVNVRKWNKLQPGDAVVFYGSKKIYLAAYIAVQFRNKELATRLWSQDKDGSTWELMFALKDVRDTSIPIEEVRESLGWSERAYIQGFQVISGYKADRLAELVNLQPFLDIPTIGSPNNDQRSTESGKETSTKSLDGLTDGNGSSRWRREQAQLKRRLVEISDDICAICGRRLPLKFLVGAHIKKRHFCSEAERKDYDNVAMLACLMGCDSLYENGYVTIDQGGQILISQAVYDSPDVAQFVQDRLSSRISHWWTESRDQYYAWHREHVFIRSHDGRTNGVG